MRYLQQPEAQTVASIGYRVEVLTTCCSQAFVEWSTNDLPPGESKYGDVTVRRFPCNARKAEIFAAGWRAMDAGLALTADEQRDMIRHSITSTAMMEFIRDRQDDYVFCFIPYLYGTTVQGVQQLPPQTAVLIPCLHDEPIARMNVFRDVFHAAHSVLFLSEPEMAVSQHLYELPEEKLHLLGGGLSDRCAAADPKLFRSKFPKITKPYVLCVGRKVPGKGSDITLEHYGHMLRDNLLPPELDLVLIGDGELDVPDFVKHRVHSIKCPDNDTVYSAMAGAVMLIQASRLESFSIVMMEAWLNGRPVLVNGDCAVTRHHVWKCGGGLWFEDYHTFAEALTTLLDSPALRWKMGVNGEDYVRKNWLWPRVGARFQALMTERFALVPDRG